MKIQNAEFQRNLWLEASLHRLVAIPIILGTIFYLFSFNDNPNVAVFTWSIWIFMIITCIWGGNRTADSMVSEIQERTWTSQRLTPTNPWSMVWAKLLGSSIATWYAGAFCLLAFFIAGAQLEPRSQTSALISQGLIPGALYLIGIGILCQVLGFIVGIGATEERSSLGARRAFCANIIGAIVGIIGFAISFQRMKPNAIINWHGITFFDFYFWLFSLYAYLVWGLIGLNAHMRREFQMQNHPLIWVGFLAFIILYITGFEFVIAIEILGEKGPSFIRWIFSFFSILTLTYLTILWEKTDGITVRRLYSLIRRGEIKKVAFEIPRWTISTVVAWILGIGLLIAFRTEFSEWEKSLGFIGDISAILLFAMRDFAIILYFRFSAKPHRATTVAILYLTILYGLLPLLMFSLDLEQFISLVYPINDGNSAIPTIFPAFLEAILIWMLAIIKWKRSPHFQLY